MSKNRLIFGGMVLAALVLLPLAVKNAYMVHLFIMAFIGIVLGMTFSMLFSAGLITLGAGAFYAIGAYGSTLLSTRLGLSFWGRPAPFHFNYRDRCIGHRIHYCQTPGYGIYHY